MNQLNTINGFSGIELEAMQKLPDNFRYFIEAKNQKKIIHCEKQEVLTQIYALIVKTIELSGESKKYNLDNQQTKNVSGFIYDTILEQYKATTLNELENAFNGGLRGEFGDYVGFGVTTFSKFLKGYMTSPKREQSLKEWMKLQNQPLTTNKPVMKFFDQNMDIANYFFKICEAKNSERFGTVINHEDNVMFLPAIMDFLNDNFKISFTDESNKTIIQKAKLKYNKYIVKSDLKEKDPKGYNSIIKSVVDGDNRTFEYYTKVETLIFLTLKLKEQGKTYNDLKRL